MYHQKALKKYNSNKVKLTPASNIETIVISRVPLKLDYKTSKTIICYCGDKKCEFNCGVLICGCIDICRKHNDFY